MLLAPNAAMEESENINNVENLKELKKKAKKEKNKKESKPKLTKMEILTKVIAFCAVITMLFSVSASLLYLIFSANA